MIFSIGIRRFWRIENRPPPSPGTHGVSPALQQEDVAYPISLDRRKNAEGRGVFALSMLGAGIQRRGQPCQAVQRITPSECGKNSSPKRRFTGLTSSRKQFAGGR